MNERVVTLILLLIIVSQVYYIFFHSPQVYEEYYPVLIVIPAVVAAYLLVSYGRRTLAHLSKPNTLMTVNEYKQHVVEESKRQVDELLKSEQFLKLMAIKQGRQQAPQLSQEKRKQQQQVLKEFQQMEKEIFDDE